MDLASFLRPLYQDVDGASHTDAMERISKIARRLYQPPTPAAERDLDLLLRFHRLGNWLDKMGNLTRTALAVEDISGAELRRTAASIKRLDAPVTEAERAVAAATLIDGAGVRGLAEHFAHARREGASQMDVLRNVLADVFVPEWMSEQAEEWLHARREARRQFCKRLLEELAVEDF